jgi:mannose-6-phosphate isomerase
MLLLQGTIQRYPWGTTDAIPTLLGQPVDGGPVAEYWLGAHPLAPATAGGEPLNQLIAADPSILGEATRERFGDGLPFLMKVLSARHALSIQAHPSREQAEEGYEREQAAGVAMDAPERTYKDNWPKPEILIALGEFHTLSGFRDPYKTEALFAALGVASDLASVIGPLTERRGRAALEEVFLDVLSLAGDRAKMSELVCAAAMQHKNDPGEVGEFARTVIELDEVFPADPGVLAALLMNRVVLQPGEAVYVPAGQMHAHLRGTGIEVMANSDNVIRGGLTPKHVDVAELIKVVDFEPRDPVITRPTPVGAGVEHYETGCPEFDVWRLSGTGAAPVGLPGTGSARVLLVVSGTIEVAGSGSTTTLAAGQSAFLAADESDVTFTGEGMAFLSSSGVR